MVDTRSDKSGAGWLVLAGAMVGLCGCTAAPKPAAKQPASEKRPAIVKPDSTSRTVLFAHNPGLTERDQAELRRVFGEMHQRLEARKAQAQIERQVAALESAPPTPVEESQPTVVPTEPPAEESDDVAPSLIVGGLQRVPNTQVTRVEQRIAVPAYPAENPTAAPELAAVPRPGYRPGLQRRLDGWRKPGLPRGLKARDLGRG